MFHLVVRHAFAHYKKGDIIKSADEIAKVSETNRHFVVRIAAPPTEVPETKPEITAAPEAEAPSSPAPVEPEPPKAE